MDESRISTLLEAYKEGADCRDLAVIDGKYDTNAYDSGQYNAALDGAFLGGKTLGYEFYLREALQDGLDENRALARAYELSKRG